MEYELKLSEGHDLWFLLGITYSAVIRAREKELEPIGISTTRSWVLWGLNYIGRPATIIEMSRLLNRDYATTSQLLKRMEKEGLIERDNNGNGRNVKIRATAEGREITKKAFNNMAMIDSIMFSLNKEERENLRSYLNRIYTEALGKITIIP